MLAMDFFCWSASVGHRRWPWRHTFFFWLKTFIRYLVEVLLDVITNFQWLINWAFMWPGKKMDYQWQQIDCQGRHGSSMRALLAKNRGLPNDRERLLWRPGNYQKLSFEGPEVMHEEKSALHFSIIKQEAPEVGRPNRPPYIWAVFLMPKLWNFVYILEFIFPLSPNLLITLLT